MKRNTKNWIFILLLVAVSTASFSLADPVKKNEKYYVQKYCKGKTNQKLVDGTIVDCVQIWNNELHVIEFDWAYQYHEALGQSLHYSVVTGKKAGIVLIIRNEKDIKYLRRLERMNKKLKYPINIKVVEVEE